MEIKNEQRFYSALKELFVGQKMEGKSGYINLMNIKSEYFDKIQSYIKKEVSALIKDKPLKEDLFQKLYTFFESYFNETGTPFFAKTQMHKNLYEKVYSEREDVALFWKTQKLYYVKSEVNYSSVENMEVDSMLFDFDASKIEHQKANEKKELQFYLVGATLKKLSFKVLYIDNSRKKFDRIKKYLKCKTPDDVREKIATEISKLKHPNIHIIKNNLKIDKADIEFIKNNLLIINNEDTINSVTVELAIAGINEIISYLVTNSITINEEIVKKAFSIYKRQNEIDYFIHKDAYNFLKEQFNIYIYNYLFSESNIGSEWSKENIEQIKKIKILAHTIIEYIARLENELKLIWEKPKFVRNSQYVFSLSMIAKNHDVLMKLIKHSGFDRQNEEWKELGILKAHNITEVKAKDLFIKGSINPKYANLPIDTKYFSDLKYDILECFDNLESSLNGILIKSENYQALRNLSNKYKGLINLIYIDPPFNTGDDFPYKDNYQTSSWLTIMSDRLEQAHELLAEDGSLFLHLDYNANHLGKFILNNLYANVNEIIFNTNATKDIEAGLYAGKSFGNNFYLQHNMILTCSKTEAPKFIKLWKPNRNDTNLGIGWLDLISVPKGKSKQRLEDFNFFIERYKNGELVYKEIERNEKIFPIGDLWNDIYSFTQSEMRTSENISFSTQKPEHLLRRIIQSTATKGDIVLDFFSGSGTTVATAHKLSRKWIGVEMGYYFDEFYYEINNKGEIEKKLGMLGRLKIVLSGDVDFFAADKKRRSHLSKDLGWPGGGFFKYYELEQYEDALRNASYNPIGKDIANINFQSGEKLLDALIIDRENEKVKLHFEKLYPDVDIAETISNLIGKKIKQLNKKYVIFEDGEKIVFDEMTYEKHPYVKPLLWWKSR